MKKTIIILACCASLARLAFAQTQTTQKAQSTTEQVTVTGTTITAIADGAAASYQPPKTLVVREDSTNKPGTYVLNGPGHVVNKKGETIQTAIKPGARVRVYYTSSGDTRAVDHVEVVD